jgi:phage baseplate assembly protein W
VAQAIYRDASLWRQIVDYNQLEAPYFLSDTSNFNREVTASGLVTFTRKAGVSGAYTIPAGSAVYTALDSFGIQRTYLTQTAVTLASSAASVDASVVCTFAGEFGNIGAGLITGFDAGLSAFIGSVTNADDFTNGRIWALKLVGETIVVPDTNSPAPPLSMENDYLTQLGKKDLMLQDDGELAPDNLVSSDIASCEGLANIAQALQHRLMTTKGELPLHPDYGTNLQAYVGANLPFTTKLIELEVMNTLQADPRVASAQVTRLQRSGKVTSVEALVTLVGRSEADGFSLTIPL